MTDENQNPYRQAREVESDALSRMTGPSPKEVGWDEGFAAAPCDHEYQHNPASDDFGVCAKCGDEENAGSVQDGDSTPRPDPTPAGDGEGTEYARLTAALVELVACARLKWCGYEQEPRFGAALDEARSALAAADRDKPDEPHTQDCRDAMFMHHAATGGDMECTCRPPVSDDPVNDPETNT